MRVREYPAGALRISAAMRRAISQPSLVHSTNTSSCHDCTTQNVFRSDSLSRFSFQTDATSLSTLHLRGPRHLGLAPQTAPENSPVSPGPATAAPARTTGRSQSHKHLSPLPSVGAAHAPGLPHATSVLNLSHAGSSTTCSSCSLPPRAVMRSFLSAAGHVSAGRLAKPVCSSSSSCLSNLALKDPSASTPDLSHDLAHALERQGRTSSDATHSAALSSSVGPSRHSMDTDPGGSSAHLPPALHSVSAPLASCPAPCRASIGSRAESAAAPGEEERVCIQPGECMGGIAFPVDGFVEESREAEGAQRGAAVCCSPVGSPLQRMHAKPAFTEPHTLWGAVPEDCVSEHMHAAGPMPMPMQRLQRSHRSMPEDGAAAAEGYSHMHAAEARAPPVAHPLADTPAVAVAMSSLLFRPAAATAATPAAAAAPAGVATACVAAPANVLPSPLHGVTLRHGAAAVEASQRDMHSGKEHSAKHSMEHAPGLAPGRISLHMGSRESNTTSYSVMEPEVCLPLCRFSQAS